ncbi:MAG: DUF4249 domain-containing protein [Bacteroidaceae bacterium]|nr:DUF4249 domain-containing protein [Bacteroidaceae bacterium]
MKKISIIGCLMALLMASCIDEYNANLPESDSRILVVEGSIVSESSCEFLLSTTVPLNTNVNNSTFKEMAVANAEVWIEGTDGQRFNATMTEAGKYVANVGTLNENHAYSLKIQYNGNTYESTPAKPAVSPDIEKVWFEQPREDMNVDALISLKPSKDGKPQYFKWSFYETWMVASYYHSDYEYNPKTDKIEPAEVDFGLGYMYNDPGEVVMASSETFQGNKIEGFRLLTLPNNTNRFVWRYCLTVNQRAISKEEYEFENMRKKLSSDMGGLFSPQPSELPSNIHCTSAKLNAIGFVGVSGNVVTNHYFADGGSEIKSNFRMDCAQLADETKARYTNLELYKMGFRVSLYTPMGIEWSTASCVDVRQQGAVLEKPDFWN